MNELDKFKKQYLALVKRMTDATYQLVLAGQSKDQILRILASNDFKQTIMNDKEFQKSFDELDAMHVKALKNMKKFADISPSTLQALTMVNKSVFMDKLATDIASTLKGNLTSGILGGLFSHDYSIDDVARIGVMLHSITGNILTVTPDNNYVGDIIITVVVSDGDTTDSAQFTLTVIGSVLIWAGWYSFVR